MNKTLRILTIIYTTLIFVGCSSGPKYPDLTPMEIQSMQTKEFETTKDRAFASVLYVFQDLNYVINNADKDTGFISATSPTESTHDWLFTGDKYTGQVKATAFVEKIRENYSKVRLNFVRIKTESSIWGQDSREDIPILDAEVYQNAFARIDEAIFVRTATE